MKFRFCGDLDCPDWVLAEISILSKITSVKMKLLSVQVIKDILGNEIDYQKVAKLTADAKYEESDIKASVAALNFILTSAAKYSVDSESLSHELQQLGLPKEHTSSLCKAYGDNLTDLQLSLRQQSLRVSRLQGVEWRVDHVISSSYLQDIGEPCVQLKMNKEDVDNGEVASVSFTSSADKFRILLTELKQAYNVMETVSNQ
ncbi:COMM domain-containing protein 4-like [Dysidea avara]|uniref:COMM domain-containing protein 4-like n=1 Tax=Dysidea avara TaxID=196820 RepID=UPI00332806FC